MNKNFFKACKRYFTTKETWQDFDTAWQRVLNSVTEETYEINLESFQHQPGVCVRYCMETWLTPWKPCIIRAWVDHLPHFGHTVTSRIEGCYGKIKQYLGTSSGDLKNVYDKLCLYWEAQKARYTSELAQAMIRPTHSTHQPLYSAVLSKVHPYALGKILEQQQKLLRLPLPPCTGTFTHSMGLPCSHNLLILRQNNSYIRLEDIHPHWFFDRTSLPTVYLQPPVILDPLLVICRRRRPRRAGNRQVLDHEDQEDEDENNESVRG